MRAEGAGLVLEVSQGGLGLMLVPETQTQTHTYTHSLKFSLKGKSPKSRKLSERFSSVHFRLIYT